MFDIDLGDDVFDDFLSELTGDKALAEAAPKVVETKLPDERTL